MLLADWLRREGITRRDFAGRIGATPAHITGICNGDSLPGCELLARIERETDGEVTARDFVPALPPEEAA